MDFLKTIELYKKIYKLPIISYKEEVSNNLIKQYKQNHFFAVIAIYNSKKELFFIRDFNKNIGWELPGGYVENSENILKAVNRITTRETGLEINEIEPVAIVENNFLCDNKKIKNIGISFLAHVKGKIKDYPKNLKGCFVNNFGCKLAYQNNKIISLALNKIGKIEYLPPQDEIDSIKTKTYKIFHFLHRLFVKKIGNFASIALENKILSLIKQKPKIVLDASCGDSKVIEQISKKYNPKICIGNDICLGTIFNSTIKANNITFTNHNILNLPFKTKFDLIIFKNTLHHIKAENQKKLLAELKKITKQLIVIDVDDPNHSSFLSGIWNKYYVYILKDKGNYFLNYKNFSSIVQRIFSSQEVDIGRINTIKGPYFFASISDLK